MSGLREGFRRLSWVTGSVAALVWAAFLTILAANASTFPGVFLLALLVGGAFWFLVVWALTRGVGWVVRGFKGD